MKKTLITGALAAATMVGAPAFAQQASKPQPSKVDQVSKELDDLSRRVDKLERDKTKLEADNAELKQKNDQLEATTEYLRSNALATRKELAQDAVAVGKIADIEKSSKSADWASRITWKGDLRYRDENVDPEEAITDQNRQRVRVRVGLSAKINDTLTGVVQLATNGGTGDPRSTNQTLGSGFDRKGLGFDLFYVDWKTPLAGLNLQLGKVPQPFQKVGSYFWDSDITPEGAALKYGSGIFFASAYAFQLGERATASDPTVIGGQFGVKMPLGATTLTTAIGYYNVGAVNGKVVTVGTGCTATLNPAFFASSANGNTTVNVGGCSRLANDFNDIEGLAQLDFKVGAFPLSVFVDYLQNKEADSLDTAESLGATLGKAADPHTWEVGYVYQKTEKDSVFGQFVDSDFGGGVTDVDGNVLKFAYAPAKNWLFNATYFMNKRFIDAGPERDYDRWQLDFVYKF